MRTRLFVVAALRGGIAALILGATLLAGCSNPKSAIVPTDLEHMDSVKGSLEKLTPEELERKRQLDDAYKAATNKIPDQKADDPWADVRPAPSTPAAKKKQQ